MAATSSLRSRNSPSVAAVEMAVHLVMKWFEYISNQARTIYPACERGTNAELHWLRLTNRGNYCEPVVIGCMDSLAFNHSDSVTNTNDITKKCNLLSLDFCAHHF